MSGNFFIVELNLFAKQNVVLVLLSARGERFSVSRMQDFSASFDKTEAISWNRLWSAFQKLVGIKKFSKTTSYDHDQQSNLLILGQLKCPFCKVPPISLIFLMPSGNPCKKTFYRIQSVHFYVEGKYHILFTARGGWKSIYIGWFIFIECWSTVKPTFDIENTFF